MIRKDVLMAIIATFCLTASAFMVTTSKSQSGVGEYNPWADYNEDGKIDIFDIVPGAVSFGAEGDSTKNVSVTNWPKELEPKTIIVCQNYTVAAGDYWLPFAPNIEGYKTVSLFLAASKSETNPANLICCSSCQNITLSNVYLANLEFQGTKWEGYGDVNLAPGAPELRFRIVFQNGYAEIAIVLYCYN